jgi:outer membrane lipoprotein
MNVRTFHPALLALLLFWGAGLSGCAPTFPQSLTDRADRSLSFTELRKDPERFKGTWVMLGGAIISAKSGTNGGTVLEVLQKPLDSDGRPLDTDKTEGRFLIASDQFLDSAVYHQGRLITVVGEVTGARLLPLDEITYQYPLLRAEALHLWTPSSRPRFFFGIGVSGRM